ncbi:QRFP-like peptide receptor [Actinia tenebrosa]|uniref:QRFP-like peptide receptor n=1 Tax=Actinia tenebrosa TaxID=6105 RepID=A0A6P8ISW9_ACTTE|nr:QRFP-like peptide receptor [Actinia tenebrosa]XP_031570292.1 QRFP-like peptide receptor [Actinia tenebrosa]XP_031570293.1 QRFP-like peptide receptor [Actinia tenebrosa]XP_031570294.1 QRFP-like peptide receptor [Actinia tenebrosa]XP_031570295.1 QRFP-like peptide receptor [Actinia tenebrosa]
MRHLLLNNTTYLPPAKGAACAASATDTMFVKAFKTILLLLIMVAALLGNLFIIIIVYKKKNMRRTTNIFIANMAASDIFVAVVVIPRILVELYIQPRIWLIDGITGSFLCKFCFFFADFSVCISIISHAVIAVDRFWAIVYSLRQSPISAARRKYLIALIWVFSFLLCSPNLYIYRVYQINGTNYCVIDWSPLDNTTSKKAFITVILIFVFCIPVLLMMVLYSWLVISLKTKQSLSAQTSQVRKQRRKEDIRVFRKVIVMVTVFLFSTIPLVVLAMLSYYIWDSRLPCGAWSFAFIAHLLFLSNCGINPCLCIALHESYRHYIRKRFCAWRKKLLITASSQTAKTYSLRQYELTANGDGSRKASRSRSERNGKGIFIELDPRKLVVVF